MPSVRALELTWCQRCPLCLTVPQVCQPGCQVGALSAALPLHWGVGKGGLKCSQERESSAFWFICCYAGGQLLYRVAQSCEVSMLEDTQTSTGHNPEPYFTLLWAGSALSDLQRCLQHRLFCDPWEKLFCSKAAVYLIFLIVACISTRHNSANYVTSSGTGKVLHLFFYCFSELW